MTLRELLKQNELRVVEVAAGADGLARTISGAVMFDNPEMVNWMRAGEIMLTTGYFLLDDPVKQEKVLRDLADSGSGGLVIKMKRYFHEIPPAMLQLADELHFPLMRIPYHTSLSEISEAVSKYVYGINEEQALQMVYQAMFDVLQGHAEVEYLLKKCAPLLHVPLLYMTPSRKIQCVSQMLQPGLREELAVGQVLFSVPERVKEVEKLRTAGLSAGIYPLQQEDKCVHIYPIHSEQEIMGYLGAIRPANAPLTENENTLYRRIAAACTLVLIKKRGFILQEGDQPLPGRPGDGGSFVLRRDRQIRQLLQYPAVFALYLCADLLHRAEPAAADVRMAGHQRPAAQPVGGQVGDAVREYQLCFRQVQQRDPCAAAEREPARV